MNKYQDAFSTNMGVGITFHSLKGWKSEIS